MGLKRFVLVPVALLLLWTTACIADSREATPPVLPTATAVAPTNLPEPTLMPTAETAVAVATPPTQPTNSPTSGIMTATTADLSITAKSVQLYPVPEIYAGDKVTFQIHPQVPSVVDVNDVVVSIYVDDQHILTDLLAHRNWAGQAEGLFSWAWDTNNLTGEHEVRVILDPHDVIQTGDEITENNEIIVPVTVNNPRNLSRLERNATWESVESACCTIYALTGTAAHRDLHKLDDLLDTAVTEAAAQLDEHPERKLNVYFIDRTIGQGGFAGSDMVVTYSDRQYAGGNLHELLVHEAVHLLDRQFAPGRIKFLAEGVAVWASGGHYKAEDLHERSAALVAMGEYIPLTAIVDDFYPVQHEIGYLEAGGFVTYLIDRYGWPTFREFYSETSSDDANSETAALNLNLQQFYDKSLAEMEAEWQMYLAGVALSETAVTDLQTTIRFYETMRSYQQQYDPTAHFLTAWLPPPREVREGGNPADLARRPETEQNIALEIMLQNADKALLAQEYHQANVLLESIERILAENGAFVDPLSTSYFGIVKKAMSLDYEIQQIELQGDTAVAFVKTANKSTLNPLRFALKPKGWVLTN